MMETSKNIRTIAPFLADGIVLADDFIEFNFQEYSHLLIENAVRLGVFGKYLVCKLHDSKVIEINSGVEQLTIMLNDFTTWIFASTLIHKYELDIDIDSITFPIAIVFEKNVQVQYFKTDYNGNLEPIRSAKVQDYLYEQLLTINPDLVEVAFHFWGTSGKRKRRGEDILMKVSAKNVAAIECQHKSWRAAFKCKYDEIYNYFRSAFDGGRYLSDKNDFITLIEEFERIQQQKPTA